MNSSWKIMWNAQYQTSVCANLKEIRSIAKGAKKLKLKKQGLLGITEQIANAEISFSLL